MNQETTPEPLSLHLIYDLAQEHLRLQLGEIESTDRKLGLIFATSSIILGAFAAFLTAREETPPALSMVAYAESAAVYVVIVLFAVWAYRALRVEFPPNVAAVWEEALFWPENTTKRAVLAQMVEATEVNRERISSKVKLTQIALYLVPLELALALVGTISLYFLG